MAKTVKMRDKPIVFSALEVANICGVVIRRLSTGFTTII